MANKYKQEKKKEAGDELLSVRECTHPRRARRQESVDKCVEARAKRSAQQQLTHLDKLLGKNKGAKKERARLNAEIAESKKQKNKSKKR